MAFCAPPSPGELSQHRQSDLPGPPMPQLNPTLSEALAHRMEEHPPPAGEPPHAPDVTARPNQPPSENDLSATPVVGAALSAPRSFDD